jgi:hypothetical protein
MKPRCLGGERWGRYTQNKKQVRPKDNCIRQADQTTRRFKEPAQLDMPPCGLGFEIAFRRTDTRLVTGRAYIALSCDVCDSLTAPNHFHPRAINRLAWCFAGAFAATFPFPPFDETEAGPLIPNVAPPDPIEGNEPVDASGDADLLDDSHALLEGTDWAGCSRGWCRWVVVRVAFRRKVHGGYFGDFIDTKSLSLSVTYCDKREKLRCGAEERTRTSTP